MTATATKPTRKPKPARKARVEESLGLRLLVITETEELKAGPRVTVTSYRLAELAADFGRLFELRKLEDDGGEVYHTAVGGAPGNGDRCDCKGGTYSGHCRHAESLRALIAAGRI